MDRKLLRSSRMATSLSHLLVTFDVDGTLVRPRGVDANKFHKVSQQRCCSSLRSALTCRRPGAARLHARV